MNRTIMVTSFKGGVGKTTFSANIASTLTAMGFKVLVIDADFHMRCMDIVLGTEDSFLFDCGDIILGRCCLSDAVVKGKYENSPSLLPAPMDFKLSELPENAISKLVQNCKTEFDYIIIDSSSECPEVYDEFAKSSDMGIVLTLHQSTAIRAAEVTAENLEFLGLRDVKLVINSYHPKGAVSGMLPDVLETVTRSGISLLGVVAFDPRLIVDQENGRSAFDIVENRRAKMYEITYANIAKRILGMDVPMTKPPFIIKKMKYYL